MTRNKHSHVALALAAALAMASPAKAEMVLSQVIVDLLPGKPPREDIEVWNASDERMFVAADPFEVREPGLPGEQRVPAVDPETSGILVSPQRLVLEPGERRLVRVAALGERGDSERVYRVSIRPVAGPISAEESALKVLVGYDALVLVRPERITGDIQADRDGRKLTLTNTGNAAQELYQGSQCDAAGANCRDLPPKRLYPNVTWELELPYDTPASYKSAIGPTLRDRKF